MERVCAQNSEKTLPKHTVSCGCGEIARIQLEDDTTPSPFPSLWSRNFSTRVLVCYTTLIAKSMETELELHCKFLSTSNSMHTVSLPPLKVTSVFRGPSWLWISYSIWQVHTWWTGTRFRKEPVLWSPWEAFCLRRQKVRVFGCDHSFLRRVILSQIIAAGLRNPGTFMSTSLVVGDFESICSSIVVSLIWHRVSVIMPQVHVKKGNLPVLLRFCQPNKLLCIKSVCIKKDKILQQIKIWISQYNFLSPLLSLFCLSSFFSVPLFCYLSLLPLLSLYLLFDCDELWCMHCWSIVVVRSWT